MFLSEKELTPLMVVDSKSSYTLDIFTAAVFAFRIFFSAASKPLSMLSYVHDIQTLISSFSF